MSGEYSCSTWSAKPCYVNLDIHCAAAAARYVAPEELMQLGQQHHHLATTAAATTAAGSQDTAAAGAAAATAAAGLATASQHEADTAAYLAGQRAWAALWQEPTGTQAPAAAPTATSNTGAAGDPTNSSSISTAAAIVGAAGSVRASVVQRHQLLAVYGRGGPCATAFVHAGRPGYKGVVGQMATV
jgi:hypothetical protein